MVIMVYHTLQMHYSSPILKKACIYNHTLMDALYMYVYVHYGIYVYIHRYSCYGFIYVLWVYKCFHIYICCIFSVYVCVCVVCEHVYENEWRKCSVWVSLKLIYLFKTSPIHLYPITLLSCWPLCNLINPTLPFSSKKY